MARHWGQAGLRTCLGLFRPAHCHRPAPTRPKGKLCALGGRGKMPPAVRSEYAEVVPFFLALFLQVLNGVLHFDIYEK